MLVWSIVIVHVSSWTRSRLSLCSRRLHAETIEASITHILQNPHDLNHMVPLEAYLDLTEFYPNVTEYSKNLREAFMCNRSLSRSKWVLHYSFSDYHMFSRHSPLLSIHGFIHGDDDVCAALIRVITDKQIRENAAMILAARGKRDLALLAYSEFKLPNHTLLLGAVMSRDNVLINSVIHVCMSKFAAVRGACLTGDYEYMLNISSDIRFTGNAYAQDMICYAVLGGNVDVVRHMLRNTYTFTMQNRINDTVLLYTRTHNKKYLQVLDLLLSKTPVFTIIMNSRVDLPLLTLLIAYGYNITFTDFTFILSTDSEAVKFALMNSHIEIKSLNGLNIPHEVMDVVLDHYIDDPDYLSLCMWCISRRALCCDVDSVLSIAERIKLIKTV